MRLSTIIGFFVIGLTVSCGKADIGQQCDSTDECQEGLECILNGGEDIGPDGPACGTEKLCSKPCASDDDCTSVGSGLICIADCHEGSCLVGSH